MSIEERRSMAQEEEFAEAAAVHLGVAQTSVRELIGSIPGVTRRPKDLERTLGIHASLAWRLHKFANAGSPISEARILPGLMAVSRFLDAAVRRGAPESSAHQVRVAMENVEQFIAHHAGSRKEFEAMLSGLSEHGDEAVDLKSRRATFEGQSHLLGFRADTILSCFAYAPSPTEPQTIDALTMRSIIGLRRFRLNASIVIAEVRAVHDDLTPYQDQPEPLLRSVDGVDCGLIPEFCSHPLPPLKRVITKADQASIEMQPEGLGAESAITCTIGHSFRSRLVRYRAMADPHQSSRTAVRIPCKLLVQDSLVYRGLFESRHPEVAVYTDHRGVDSAPSDRQCDRLPTRASAVFMGSGVHALDVDDVPEYSDLVQYGFGNMKWGIEDFDLYRVRIEYPLMPSSLVTEFDLRESPEA